MEKKMTAMDKRNADFQFNNLEELMYYLDNYGKEYIKYWLKETSNALVFMNNDNRYHIFKLGYNIEMMDMNTKEIKWTYNVKKGNGYDYDKATYLVYRNALEVFGKKEAA